MIVIQPEAYVHFGLAIGVVVVVYLVTAWRLYREMRDVFRE